MNLSFLTKLCEAYGDFRQVESNILPAKARLEELLALDNDQLKGDLRFEALGISIKTVLIEELSKRFLLIDPKFRCFMNSPCNRTSDKTARLSDPSDLLAIFKKLGEFRKELLELEAENERELVKLINEQDILELFMRVENTEIEYERSPIDKLNDEKLFLSHFSKFLEAMEQDIVFLGVNGKIRDYKSAALDYRDKYNLDYHNVSLEYSDYYDGDYILESVRFSIKHLINPKS